MPWVISKTRRFAPERFAYYDGARDWARERRSRGEDDVIVRDSLPLRDRLYLWLIERAKRTPYYHLDGYMERWWLLKTPWLSIRVHHILRSDADRDPHDHPFDWASLVMYGGYSEQRYTTRKDGSAVPSGPSLRYGPGSFRRMRATDLHRLVVRGNESAWTLFIMGRKKRSWGFQTPNGWVNWRDYHGVTEAQKAADDAAWGGRRP